LQDPNLAVTLNDSSGNPISGGYVSVDAQNWHSGAQTDSTGTARIFVDWNAVKSTNGVSSGPIDFHLGLHPQFGSTTSITLDCDSMGNHAAPCPTGLASLTGPFATTNWTVNLPAPNTSFTVLETSTGSVAEANGWAQILTYQPASGSNSGYITGNVGASNTSGTGLAVFNVTDTTKTFAVQVNPSWSDSTYASKLYTNNGAGLTWSQVNGQTFTLGSPNLTVNSKTKDGAVNIGGGVCAFYFNGQNGYQTSWIACLGVNQNGTAKLLLLDTTADSIPDTQYILLSFNPGDASYGATVSCTVTVSNGVVQNSGLPSSCVVVGGVVTQNLSSGNVRGNVVRADQTPVVGAIVKATQHGLTGAAAEATAISTSTGTDGTYGLQLDPSKPWDLKIIPIHVKGLSDLETITVDTITATDSQSGVPIPANNSSPGYVTLQPIVLATKP
jgi:hypothetical protein